MWVCLPSTRLLGDIQLCSCGVACIQFAAVYSSDTWRQNLTPERQSTFTISHFYLFIFFFFHLFLYFLKHKLLKQLSKRGHQYHSQSRQPAPSESPFFFLSDLLVSVLSIVLPISPVFEHLALHSTCQSLVQCNIASCFCFVEFFSSGVSRPIHVLLSVTRSCWSEGVFVQSEIKFCFWDFPRTAHDTPVVTFCSI